MKKFYEAPALEVIKFDQEAVLASGTGNTVLDQKGDSSDVGPSVGFDW